MFVTKLAIDLQSYNTHSDKTLRKHFIPNFIILSKFSSRFYSFICAKQLENKMPELVHGTKYKTLHI